MEIRKELKSGVVELAILAILAKKDLYGYEVSQEFALRSRDRLEVKEGTLYPILYRLEEKKVIESYWEAPSGRGKPRKYYRLTAKGKTYLERYRQEWQVISEFMQNVLQ